MQARALIVVLVVLNLGVGLWWALRPEVVTPSPTVAAGVASLELVPMPAGADRPAPAPAATQPATTPDAVAAPTPAAPAPATPVAAERQCVRLGPFASEVLAKQAVERAGDALGNVRLREVGDEDATSYRVVMPAGDKDAAQTLARRIAAAGFKDYYVMGSDGSNASVALGQYRSREGAERRQNELAEKGFAAELLSSGGSGQSRWWIDGVAIASPAVVQQRSGASRERSLDCTSLR